MEVVVRALVFAVFLFVVTRVVGRATLSELTAFELIMYVVMGDLIQQAVTQQDYSVTGGILAISVFALLTIAAGYAVRRWRQVRPTLHGVPYVLIRGGELVAETMRMERVSMDDLLIAVRQQGILRFSDIDLAVLETNGRISFFTGKGTSDGAAAPPDQLG
ncbi:Protein of unknown function [Modestobacter sp. DSM 44400]|uniref:DUF421 domain-containing protein n=1 Tax=Modestobacter sp. DSM 44400 TaxID=1550230 RepID=UPI00089C2830|nr:YetF domain-containing protein [Modestobacter sp. DSM 44400]SDY46070.1 Protein of unknown function [Modestobacter sp. DSM 44400]